MNVRTICLAILYDGDSTGYEIRKLSTEGEYSYFIDASYGAKWGSNQWYARGHVIIDRGRPRRHRQEAEPRTMAWRQSAG